MFEVCCTWIDYKLDWAFHLNYYYYYYYYLFTAIGIAPGGSSHTLVQTKTMKQHYTVVQHNTINRKQHNTIKRKHKVIRT
jgi:hypothetical protein